MINFPKYNYMVTFNSFSEMHQRSPVPIVDTTFYEMNTIANTLEFSSKSRIYKYNPAIRRLDEYEEEIDLQRNNYN